MKFILKPLLVYTLLIIAFHSNIYAEKPTFEDMTIKLSNLEVDITKQKLVLLKREEKLNEMKVKSLHSNKIDKKKMALKLAEIETSLAKDKLLVSKREVKLYEMKVALLKIRN